MPTFIQLARWTDAGGADRANFEESVAEARRIFEAHGCTWVQAWATLGRYDIVAIIEAPNEKIMMQASAAVAARGAFRAETLAAIPLGEFARAVSAGRRRKT
jgi:uncharacterized protein with GYD domain